MMLWVYEAQENVPQTSFTPNHIARTGTFIVIVFKYLAYFDNAKKLWERFSLIFKGYIFLKIVACSLGLDFRLKFNAFSGFDREILKNSSGSTTAYISWRWQPEKKREIVNDWNKLIVKYWIKNHCELLILRVNSDHFEMIKSFFKIQIRNVSQI